MKTGWGFVETHPHPFSLKQKSDFFLWLPALKKIFATSNHNSEKKKKKHLSPAIELPPHNLPKIKLQSNKRNTIKSNPIKNQNRTKNNPSITSTGDSTTSKPFKFESCDLKPSVSAPGTLRFGRFLLGLACGDRMNFHVKITAMANPARAPNDPACWDNRRLRKHLTRLIDKLIDELGLGFFDTLWLMRREAISETLRFRVWASLRIRDPVWSVTRSDIADRWFRWRRSERIGSGGCFVQIFLYLGVFGY